MASWEFNFYFIAFPSQKLSNEALSSDYIQPLLSSKTSFGGSQVVQKWQCCAVATPIDYYK